VFTTVLIANRGEIACRVLRTLRDLGIRSVAVYTEADRGARHVRAADCAVPVGNYLDIDELIDVALRSGAEAVHPGYGFLSENADFARACATAGIVFIGPDVHALDVMGDKVRAKDHVAARGVPVIPGAGRAGMSDDELAAAAAHVGFPLLVKPSCGGGGKGMTVVASPDELPAGLAMARRVALRAFGNDTLLLERLVHTPRHIEVQVLADRYGHVIHLGERECSLQRRHQKIVEEAPSPLLDESTRAAMGNAACEVARSVDYVGAGTVEFLVSDAAPGEFFFLEMNTRLQVEHPVTELVTGVDLVEWQLRIADGERLTLEQDDIALTGHAVEVRLYAEDPAAGFLPTTGTVLALAEPTRRGIRVDSALAQGLVVSSAYDPMLAKIIAWGSDRAQAIARLDRALADTTVLGLRTNQSFLRALLAEPDVRAGRLDTGLVERILADLRLPVAGEAAVAAAALLEHSRRWSGGGPWSAPSGWRLGEHRPVRYTVAGSTVAVLGSPGSASVDGQPVRFRHDGDTATVESDGTTTAFRWARDGNVIWLSAGGSSCDLRLSEREELLAAHRATLSKAAGAVGPDVRTVLPGTVVAVSVSPGELVRAQQPLLTIEAMKMEHVVLAPMAGVVTLAVDLGMQVRLDQVVARITPEEGAA
jgi:acetyl-CoA/propionyl-CoA carboxylase biotin carboxyl carrier protein